MLLYYDDYIIVTNKLISYGQYSRSLAVPVNKVYDVNDFLLICCDNCVHIYCKINKCHEVTTCFEHFVVNYGYDQVLIIDVANSCSQVILDVVVLRRHEHRKVLISREQLLSGNLKKDINAVPLHVVSKGLFRGFADICVTTEN